MKVRKIGIIGLGNVGEAVLKTLKKRASLIKGRTSLTIEMPYRSWSFHNRFQALA